jgi:membrane-associated phospholipid phosphatase
MIPALRDWEIASGLLFAYTAVLASAVRGLRGSVRVRTLAGSAGGLVVVAGSVLIPPNLILHGWLLPPLLLLLAYWTTGLLFTTPMPRAEQALRQIDRALGIRRLASVTPRWIAEVLEFWYVAVYALIPLALLVHVQLNAAPDYSRFWTVILVTDYICFAVLPWIRTRPPRALEPDDPWPSSLRQLNLRLLGSMSIRVNTFPSGHAAEALAAVLLTSDAPGPVVAWMLFGAVGVSAGAVLGRYHYAADAITGWLVAVAVWRLFG